MKKWLLEEGAAHTYIWERAKGYWFLLASKLPNDSWYLHKMRGQHFQLREVKVDEFKYTELTKKELFVQLL